MLCYILNAVLETLYYVSGIVVALGVLFAMRQYYLSKKNVHLKYHREINSITGEQLRLFYVKIVPSYEAVKNQLSCNMSFSLNNKKIINLSDTELENSCKNYMSSIRNDGLDTSLKALLVELQIFAISFQFGLADCKLAQDAVLNKYLEICECVLPVIFIDTDRSLYTACIELYNQWKVFKLDNENKKEAKEIETKKQEIQPFHVKGFDK